MVSSKKERGKQRRALQKACPSGSNNEKSIVKSIRNGHREVTWYVANKSVSGLSFDDSGILSAVLDFLKRCEHETFDEVTCTFPYQILILATPSSWINVVLMAYLREKTCRVQIAQNIGPLVRCMCADTKRFFFKSRNIGAKLSCRL